MTMFDFFKNKKEANGLDAKGLRDLILQFVKEELQRLDGGEGKDISVIQLFIEADEAGRFLYETAVFVTEPARLEEEVQRIADNYAIALPLNWKLEVLFEDVPAGAIRTAQLSAGLVFKRAVKISAPELAGFKGRLFILKGHAEKEEYQLETVKGRINIGREKNIQANDGSFRINHVAFPARPDHENNKYISRQHAHIEWDPASALFKIYADEGGVPPGNKTKIRSAADESVQKLNSTNIGYPLQDGDQIILGDAAVLEFNMLYS